MGYYEGPQPPRYGFNLFDFFIDLCITGAIYTLLLELTNQFAFPIADKEAIASIVQRGAERPPDDFVSRGIVLFIQLIHWSYGIMVPWVGGFCFVVVIILAALMILNLTFANLDYVLGPIGAVAVAFGIGCAINGLADTNVRVLSILIGIILMVVGVILNGSRT